MCAGARARECASVCVKICLCKKKLESQSDNAASFAMCCIQYMGRKRKSILYFLYWFLHFIKHALKATQYLFHCVQLFSDLSEKIPPPPFGSEALQSRGLWFSSHFIRLTRGSLCDLPLLRSLPLSLTTVVLRIVICWFPWQPTRTCVQGELTDIEWKNMKQWLLAQMLVPFIRLLHTLPISLSDIKNLLLKVILRYNQTFFFLNSVLPELPSIIFSLPLTFWERLQFSRRKRALICFSLHQGSPINVKREIRGLHEVNKKNKSQWASTKRGHCYQSSN